MFNGIVETLGNVIQHQWSHDCLHLNIQPMQAWQDLSVGDSVSVNGVCLTITALQANSFSVDVVPETLRLSNLNLLATDAKVNLERSLQVAQRIGGHYVQGHVDGVGEIIDINTDGKKALLVKIKLENNLTRYIVKKGYVAIDGMSITVVAVADDHFVVTFIPHTQAVTIVQHYNLGTKVNIEVDILGKYVEKLLEGYANAKNAATS